MRIRESLPAIAHAIIVCSWVMSLLMILLATSRIRERSRGVAFRLIVVLSIYLASTVALLVALDIDLFQSPGNEALAFGVVLLMCNAIVLAWMKVRFPTDLYLLSEKARYELVQEIRKVQKQRQELVLGWAPFVSAATGVIGALTGLVAVVAPLLAR